MKIYYLPLDKRPCNIDYIKLTSEFIKAKLYILENNELLDNKLLDTIKQINESVYFIISLDAYLYKDLINSRKYNLTYTKTKERFNKLLKLIKENPKIKFFIFSHITRLSPTIQNLHQLNQAKIIENISYFLYKKDIKKVKDLIKNIDKDFLSDYLKVRARNFLINLLSIKSFKDLSNVEFIIGLDDITNISLNLAEYKKLKKHTNNLLYGLDDLANLILSKIVLIENNINNLKINLIYLYKKSFFNYKTIYENTTIYEIIKKQLNFLKLNFFNIKINEKIDKDLPTLFIYNFSKKQIEASKQRISKLSKYEKKRIDKLFKDYRYIAIGDVRYTNGGCINLINYLINNKLFNKLYSISAWNTTANTLSTALSDLIINYIYKKKNKRLIKLHYLDDYIYQSKIRKKLNYILKKDHINIYKLNKKEKERAIKFIEKELKLSVSLPFSRTFEIKINNL